MRWERWHSWIFANQTGSGFKGKNKYQGFGRVGSTDNGRRATAKRKGKRKKK